MIIRKEIKKQGYMLGFNPVSMIKYSRRLKIIKRSLKNENNIRMFNLYRFEYNIILCLFSRCFVNN